MYKKYLQTSMPMRLFMKMIALILLPIPGVLLLLFTAGSFILTIIAGICGLGASVAVLAMIILLLTEPMLTVQMALIGFGAAAFLGLLSGLLTIGKEVIEFILIQTVSFLTGVLFAPLRDQIEMEKKGA